MTCHYSTRTRLTVLPDVPYRIPDQSVTVLAESRFPSSQNGISFPLQVISPIVSISPFASIPPYTQLDHVRR